MKTAARGGCRAGRLAEKIVARRFVFCKQPNLAEFAVAHLQQQQARLVNTLVAALARQTERAGDEVAVGHRRAVGRQLQGVASVFDEAANHAQHIFLALMRAGKRIVAGLVPADVVRHQAGKGVHATGREGVEAGGDGVSLGRVSMGCSYEMTGSRILAPRPLPPFINRIAHPPRTGRLNRRLMV